MDELTDQLPNCASPKASTYAPLYDWFDRGQPALTRHIASMEDRSFGHFYVVLLRRPPSAITSQQEKKKSRIHIANNDKHIFHINSSKLPRFGRRQ